MSYKSENWKEKLDEVRNYIEPRKEGTVEKTAEQIISDEIDQELSTYFSEDTLPEVEDIKEFEQGLDEVQQKEVRSNREFNSLSKEVEFQELEIQLAEKQIRELKASTEHKKEVINDSKDKLEQKTTHLKHKKAELNDIMAETQKEEAFLIEKSAEYESLIEERLLAAYKRIRSSVRNGLAVVSIERGASAGSFFTIPPQVQMEIASRKKIITDEHSGRILVDEVLANEQKEKMGKLFTKIAKI